jgi:chorismate mutase/prephenate dehydratase
MPKNKELEPLRNQIDQIDDRLLNLINDRVRLASEIGSRKTGLGAPVYRPEREVQILDRLIKSSQGPLSEDAIKTIFREIISAARGVEALLTVAVLGPKGTFTEQAAYKVFGQQIEVASATSIKEVFRLTESGAAHFGVVPVENSTEGGVNATLDLMLETELTICNEVDLRVSHCLLAHPGAKKSKTIAGHEQALAQCRGWLAENWPQLDQIATSSTADAAKAAAEDPTFLQWLRNLPVTFTVWRSGLVKLKMFRAIPPASW